MTVLPEARSPGLANQSQGQFWRSLTGAQSEAEAGTLVPRSPEQLLTGIRPHKVTAVEKALPAAQGLASL